MPTIMTTLTRRCARMAILASLLLLAAEVVESVFVDTAALSVTPSERIAATLFFTGAIALTIGLVGIYLHQVEAAGRFGTIAFLVALVGSALMISSDWNQLFAGPTLLQIPNIATDFPPLMIAGFLMNYGCYLLGWMLFGLATYRARVFPRAAGLLLIVSILLSLTRIPGIFALFYATIGWLGILTLRPGTAEVVAADARSLYSRSA